MPTTLLSGYYGRRNCGDDAMLRVAAWGARRYLGASRLYATGSRQGDAWPQDVRPLYLDPSKRGTHHLNGIREYLVKQRIDSIVFGGGSVFHSDEDHRRYLTWLSAARGPRLAAGVSIGPFATAAAEASCARVLSQMSFVGVRDQASLERARSLSPSVRVEHTFDIAPLLLTDGVEPIDPAQPSERELAISLCAFSGDATGGAWLEQVVVALDRLVRRGLVERIVLIDFNGEGRNAGPTDHQLHQRLARALAGRVSIEHLPYRGDPRSTAARLQKSSAVLAMRLHAAVFAYALGRPCAVIGYHEKSLEWCREIGLPQSLSVDLSEVESSGLERMLETVLSPAPPRPVLPREQALERAMRNWTWLRTER